MNKPILTTSSLTLLEYTHLKSLTAPFNLTLTNQLHPNTSYLLCHKPTLTKKYIEAIKRGIDIINVQGLYHYIESKDLNKNENNFLNTFLLKFKMLPLESLHFYTNNTLIKNYYELFGAVFVNYLSIGVDFIICNEKDKIAYAYEHGILVIKKVFRNEWDEFIKESKIIKKNKNSFFKKNRIFYIPDTLPLSLQSILIKLILTNNGIRIQKKKENNSFFTIADFNKKNKNSFSADYIFKCVESGSELCELGFKFCRGVVRRVLSNCVFLIEEGIFKEGEKFEGGSIFKEGEKFEESSSIFKGGEKFEESSSIFKGGEKFEGEGIFKGGSVFKEEKVSSKENSILQDNSIPSNITIFKDNSILQTKTTPPDPLIILTNILTALGAQLKSTFSPQITHIISNDLHSNTFSNNIQILSVHDIQRILTTMKIIKSRKIVKTNSSFDLLFQRVFSKSNRKINSAALHWKNRLAFKGWTVYLRFDLNMGGGLSEEKKLKFLMRFLRAGGAEIVRVDRKGEYESVRCTHVFRGRGVDGVGVRYEWVFGYLLGCGRVEYKEE